jgi:hypothetical protein
MGHPADAGQEYQLTRPGAWWRPVIMPPLLVLLAGAAVGQGSWVIAAVMVALLVLLLAPVVVALRWTPRRVEVDDGGVVFVAPARRARVPWSEVEAISTYRRIRGRLGLAWQFTDGRELRTPVASGALDRMLADIERRAPHVRIEV